MAQGYEKNSEFDLQLAISCARAFSVSTGLGCTVSSIQGEIFYETGHGCDSCTMCRAAGKDIGNCTRTHTYGMTEAERFGGKYIYYCPMGLTCFVSPIVGQYGSTAKITVGPFLMIDKEDYVAYDLQYAANYSGDRLNDILGELEKIPVLAPEKVNELSTLLFMAVGFMNNVSSASTMLDVQSSGAIQGQINAYIAELKNVQDLPPYPFSTEQALLQSIASSDQKQAQIYLNELLGHILLCTGGDMIRIKTRMHELLVLISRAAVNAGVSSELAFQISCEFFESAQTIQDIDKLCFQITNVVNKFIDSIFPYADIKHIDVMHKALQYIRLNYAKKLTMEEVAQIVYLSPSYFSKLFKKEMGCKFNVYLNNLRIDKSKRLLLENLKLVDIAILVGFEDQSYFTKVFKRVTGISPNKYRSRGAIASVIRDGAVKPS